MDILVFLRLCTHIFIHKYSEGFFSFIFLSRIMYCQLNLLNFMQNVLEVYISVYNLSDLQCKTWNKLRILKIGKNRNCKCNIKKKNCTMATINKIFHNHLARYEQ